MPYTYNRKVLKTNMFFRHRVTAPSCNTWNCTQKKYHKVPRQVHTHKKTTLLIHAFREDKSKEDTHSARQ